MTAPVIVLPLVGSGVIASGRAAAGFLAAFITWGLCVGALFPHVHRRLQARWDRGGAAGKLGPIAASLSRSLLRRPAAG